MSGKKKIQMRKPDYFERFQCSASDCTDNCCIGWEIDIDERTAERYKKVPGELGQKLKDRILREGEIFSKETEPLEFLISKFRRFSKPFRSTVVSEQETVKSP